MSAHPQGLRPRPVGRSPRNPAPILDTPIPPGIYGRHLSARECSALAALTIHSDTRWIVVRTLSQNMEHGICYYPYQWGVWGYAHAGVYVSTRPPA